MNVSKQSIGGVFCAAIALGCIVATGPLPGGGGPDKIWTCPTIGPGCTGQSIDCGANTAACCCPVTPATTPPSYTCTCIAGGDCGGNGGCVMGF